MGAISDYLEAALLNHVFRGVTYTPPTTLYVALYTSDPTDADTGTEVSGGGYVRQTVTFTTPSGGDVQNTTDIVFPTATASWGTITHVGIRDAATGGNLLYYGPLSVSKTIGAGDTFKIPAGQLVISLD
ncbi:MAG: phage tail fiber protein [Armatimonadota bacterium]